MMPIKPAGIKRFVPVILYTALLFVMAGYLPVLTKKAAAALTWVVYARLVKWFLVVISLMTIGAVAWRWAGMKHRLLFLAAALLYVGPTARLIAHIGGSVNEYVHFPQYATLTLLWYYSLRGGRRQGESGLQRKPLVLAASLSALTGLIEESSQIFIPLRVFDWQDVYLNLMGVILGLLLIWAFDGRRRSSAEHESPDPMKPARPDSFNNPKG